MPPLSPPFIYIHAYTHTHTLGDGIHTAMSTPESWAAETPRWAPLARAALLAEAPPEEKSPSLATAERAARSAVRPPPPAFQLCLHPQRPRQQHPASLLFGAENQDLLQQPSPQTAAGRYLGEDAGPVAAHGFCAALTPHCHPSSALCWSRWLRAAGKAPPLEPRKSLHLLPQGNVFFLFLLLLGKTWGNSPWLANVLGYIPEIHFSCLPW